MAITTNREYLTAQLSRFNVSESDIDIIMVDNPTLLDSSLDPKACKLAIYNAMSAILPVADVSEGGYSVTWNIEGLKLWYNSLCAELGKTNALKPKIRNRSNCW